MEQASPSVSVPKDDRDTDVVLDVRGLRTYFYLRGGMVNKAVDGVSFALRHRKTLAIVGESGSGKSVTARSLIRLVENPGRIVGGEVRFHGQNLLDLPEGDMRRIRGDRLALVFQNPSASLDPLKTIGQQLQEAIRVHKPWNRAEVRDRAEEVLRLVGVPEPALLMRRYPVELNAGMTQRIMIAIAISCSPDVIIADEPTTILGISVQAQILSVLKELQERLGTALLLITHDMGVVAEMADDVLVMYAGRMMEYGSMETVLADPQHPYTLGLIRSVPEIDQDRPSYLHSIPGFPPDLARLPAVCAFAPRCEVARPLCRRQQPLVEPLSNGSHAACFVAQGKAD